MIGFILGFVLGAAFMKWGWPRMSEWFAGA